MLISYFYKNCTDLKLCSYLLMQLCKYLLIFTSVWTQMSTNHTCINTYTQPCLDTGQPRVPHFLPNGCKLCASVVASSGHPDLRMSGRFCMT